MIFHPLLKRHTHKEFRLQQTLRWWEFKPNGTKAFNERLLCLSDKEKVAFIVTAAEKVSTYYCERRGYSSDSREYQINSIWNCFMRHLLKTKLHLDDEDFTTISHAFIDKQPSSWLKHICDWPASFLVIQIERALKTRPCTESLKNTLELLAKEVAKPAHYYDQKKRVKLDEKINAIIHQFTQGEGTVKPTYFNVKDDFAAYANDTIDAATDKDKPYLFRLIALARRASGAKPAAKFLEESKALFKEMGVDKFKKVVNDWFEFVIRYKEPDSANRVYDGTIYYAFLAAPNLEALKGFVWMCVHFHDKNTLATIAKLAERCYKKIPGTGPAAPGLGNACLYVLAMSKGMEGIAHLSRLKLRIRQNNTQTLIEKYLLEAAEEQGVSIHEIEDLAVDDYGLLDDSITYGIEGYKAVLAIAGIGKTALQWYKPDGTPQKSVPAVVKGKGKTTLNKIKETAKGIETTLTTQRDRFDRMLKTGRELTLQQFNELYHTHGLLSYITRRLIWTFTQGEQVTNAIYVQGEWINPDGVVPAFTKDTTITLWHPVFSTIAEVTAWRELLMHHQIVQPVKQAFREVYLLTDAELNTKTYSNRMAAHLLKQHQFNSLAKLRGWKYSLLGAYDGRDNEVASILLPEYNLRAEYWINEVNAEDAYNDTGIWLYVATDGVRFVDITTNTVVDLIDVPKLAFTEIMRDVDLFVGVASVGNDPQWRDSGGVTAIYHNYWQAYSFGDLTELAKTRKGILERLLPRLKIAKVASIQDKFLVVKGKLRTYKIHIGSTNILMEPNDQYLCIVPDRGGKVVTENVFLPFEGDSGLSVILSKALMLAEDDKIRDESIVRQIGRK
jgi:hypothetical protein